MALLGDGWGFSNEAWLAAAAASVVGWMWSARRYHAQRVRHAVHEAYFIAQVLLLVEELKGQSDSLGILDVTDSKAEAAPSLEQRLAVAAEKSRPTFDVAYTVAVGDGGPTVAAQITSRAGKREVVIAGKDLDSVYTIRLRLLGGYSDILKAKYLQVMRPHCRVLPREWGGEE